MNAVETNGVRTAGETFIIAKSDEGFRVCSPLNPGKQYLVTGLPDQPQCTCPEFAGNGGDPEWVCQHILAVLKETAVAQQIQPSSATASTGRDPSTPSRAKKPEPSSKNGEGAVMVLKRSVSPDGRIDSLSVEFSCSVGKDTTETLKERAQKILLLQAEIASGFLKTNGNGGNHNNGNGNGAVNGTPAQLLAVASMNGRYGKRLFLNVLVNRQVLRFFGSEKQLSEAVSAAGFPQVAERLTDGMALNLPCQVTTKPSPDGRYTNIEQVLPAAGAQR